VNVFAFCLLLFASAYLLGVPYCVRSYATSLLARGASRTTTISALLSLHCLLFLFSLAVSCSINLYHTSSLCLSFFVPCSDTDPLSFPRILSASEP